MRSKNTFATAIERGDKLLMQEYCKADLHIHAAYSCRKEFLRGKGYDVPQTQSVTDIASLISFARKYIKPIQNSVTGLKTLIEGMIFECSHQGVSLVDADIDYKACLTIFDGDVQKFCSFLGNFKQKNVNLRWIVDISRDSFLNEHEKIVLEMLNSGFFAGVDLTSTENPNLNEKFKKIYKLANNLGLITKVHAGEQLGAEYVKKCIEDFEPKQIQHGISIVDDETVMNFAKDKGVVFNVCPSSNVCLGYAESIENHPIKKMVEFGLKVTIGTDDLLFFGSDINDEYLKLYNAGVLTADQLEKIRKEGLLI